MSGKGSWRRPGKGYEEEYDRIFKHSKDPHHFKFTELDLCVVGETKWSSHQWTNYGFRGTYCTRCNKPKPE